MNENMIAVIQTVLDKSGVTKDLDAIQKLVSSNMVKITPQLETASIKNNLREVSNLIAKSITDAYRQAGNTDFKLAGNDVFKILNQQLNMVSTNASRAVTEISRLTKAESMQKWADNNSKAMKKYGKQIDEIIEKMRNLTDPMDKASFDKLVGDFKQIQDSARKTGHIGMTTFDKLKNAWEKFGGWSLATGALTSIVSKLREATTELKEINDVLTEISKTSDLTTKQLEKLGDTSFDTASKYGKKASDYLTGVQEMYRAGFDNAEEMAELSVLAQSAGDMEINSANDYLMATNAAYKYKGSVEELNKVLDSQNYITNNAAISMQDIADATTETASVASQYGVQISELSALIATATANTRESGSEVGTALKAILINLQDTTSAPVVGTLDKLGISMFKIVDGAERLKTPIELIYELSDAYNSLPEGHADRALILNEIGQKRHAKVCVVI